MNRHIPSAGALRPALSLARLCTGVLTQIQQLLKFDETHASSAQHEGNAMDPI